MRIVIVFWALLLVVLVVGAVMGLRELDNYRRRRAVRERHPLLEIKRRYELGEITRDQYEREIRAELERHDLERRGKAQRIA